MRGRCLGRYESSGPCPKPHNSVTDMPSLPKPLQLAKAADCSVRHKLGKVGAIGSPEYDAIPFPQVDALSRGVAHVRKLASTIGKSGSA